ncbi:hypothetical protein BU25DRAFT_459808 [Macroventuria anomochaeta]|uniref:Uncharacterized protein n=1 Tax=Macroventuria anomochaeta TaxID=301207 RepID=A0ACB6RUV6_9PLEO|nr:uncharacterized protein BU25DRAFT_459808 [Macroventuria anomochaeta]KAF2625836.1 hypothetical protein BU25DRAFT_459808 [Macroventuria anomochaeta]
MPKHVKSKSITSMVGINRPWTLAALYPALMFCGGSYLWPTKPTACFVTVIFAWIGFLVWDYRCKNKSASSLKALGMICHTIPALYLYGTCYFAEHAANAADIWLISVLVFQCCRTITHIFAVPDLTKLVKTAAWWWAHPMGFLLHFVFPIYPAFTYRHSIMKIHMAFTCLDMQWSGRKLPPPEKKVE